MNKEELIAKLKELHLTTISAIFEDEAERAGKLKASYTDYLAKLVEEEYLAKRERSISARIAKAKFPFFRSLDNFDFSFQPTLSPEYIKELGNLHFMEKAENIIFLGQPGTGKAHLAVAIGIRACIARKRTLYSTLARLLDDLIASQVLGVLPKRLAEISRLDLLIIDEIGYDTLDKNRANLLFQVVASRYERGSIILTSNRSFEEWGEIFGNDTITVSGMLDRLLHHRHIIAIDGPSYRTKNQLPLAKKQK
jgi:DNA replication protein DnaC